MAKAPESTQHNPPDNPSPKADGGSSQRKPDEARAASAPSGETPAQPAEQAGKSGHHISERKGQYLVAPRRPAGGIQPMGLQPLQMSVIEQALRSSPDIEVVDTVGPKNIVGVLADGMGEGSSGVLVARMSEQKAGILYQQGQGRLIVERDQALNLLDVAFQPPPLVLGANPTTGPALKAAITVLGKDNAPIKDAEVYLFGSLLPATGLTDESGQVTLSLFGETEQSIRGLYVKPKADYWSFYQEKPDISTDEPNMVGLRPISEWPSLANFPKQQAYGWGQKAMRLDQLPENYRGQGIKIAIIDSGAANSHDDLRQIRFGFDIINKKTSPDTWNEDAIAHGSHCAGVIAGADTVGGVRGFAPEAEIHACKLFPGGQVSQLIDALEYCIEKQIDVVNLSLGGSEPSEALEQQILRAKRAGIACIVAAGNSGGRVQYPASSPNVLAVAAIGRINEFPPDSYHTQTVTQVMDQNGFFSARFSCFGPEIAVCAPGVAITSSVPPNNYAVWDGTSMAAPHVTGLAALALAHHPDFQRMSGVRTAERVERLFQIIKLSARYIHAGDPQRTGFGMPDVLVAVGLQPQIGMQAAAGASLPQNALLNAIGSFLGSQAGRSLGQGYPFAPPYNPAPEQVQFAPQMAQFAPQMWTGTPQQAYGGGMGMGTGMSGMEPAYAYMQPFAVPPQMMGMTFGMHPAFGRQGW